MTNNLIMTIAAIALVPTIGLIAYAACVALGVGQPRTLDDLRRRVRALEMDGDRDNAAALWDQHSERLSRLDDGGRKP